MILVYLGFAFSAFQTCFNAADEVKVTTPKLEVDFNGVLIIELTGVKADYILKEIEIKKVGTQNFVPIYDRSNLAPAPKRDFGALLGFSGQKVVLHGVPLRFNGALLKFKFASTADASPQTVTTEAIKINPKMGSYPDNSVLGLFDLSISSNPYYVPEKDYVLEYKIKTSNGAADKLRLGICVSKSVDCLMDSSDGVNDKPKDFDSDISVKFKTADTQITVAASTPAEKLIGSRIVFFAVDSSSKVTKLATSGVINVEPLLKYDKCEYRVVSWNIPKPEELTDLTIHAYKGDAATSFEKIGVCTGKANDATPACAIEKTAETTYESLTRSSIRIKDSVNEKHIIFKCKAKKVLKSKGQPIDILIAHISVDMTVKKCGDPIPTIPTTTTSSSTAKPGSKGLSTGVILGIAIPAGIVGVCAIGAGIFFMTKKD